MEYLQLTKQYQEFFLTNIYISKLHLIVES